MEVGNLVRAECSEAIGIIVDIIDKKVWRVHDNGVKVNWDTVEPEPHAVVLYSHNDGTVSIPFSDLTVLNGV